MTNEANRGPEYKDSIRPVNTTPGPAEQRLQGWARQIKNAIAREQAEQDEARNAIKASEKRVETLQAELDDIHDHLHKIGVQTD